MIIGGLTGAAIGEAAMSHESDQRDIKQEDDEIEEYGIDW